MKRILFTKGCIENLKGFYDMFDKNSFVFEQSKKDGSDLIEKIEQFCPDIVICDVFLPNKDAICIMKKFKCSDLAPKFILILSSSNEFLEKELISNGASYYFIKPYDLNTLTTITNDLLNSSPVSYRVNGRIKSLIAEDVSNILHELGIPANIKGYNYLRFAITQSVNDYKNNSFNNKLYARISKEFNSTNSKVERSIRHAIDVAWQRADLNTINSYFKNTIDASKGKPKNSEFIAMISEIIFIKRKKDLFKKDDDLVS